MMTSANRDDDVGVIKTDGMPEIWPYVFCFLTFLYFTLSIEVFGTLSHNFIHRLYCSR